MAVEIKELVIRAIAVPEKNEAETDMRSGLSGEQMQRLVQACVDEVIKIMERKESR